jgi:hypothetical protein
MGFMVEEGLQSNGLQEWPSTFAEGLRGTDCVMAVMAGEIGVAPVQLDYSLSAGTDEGEARISEARPDGFEAKGLGAAAMAEFYCIAGEPEAG